MNSNAPYDLVCGGLALWLSSLALCSVVMAAESNSAHDWIPGISEHIAITDCVKVVRDVQTGVARIDRVLDNARGYGWDAPGARIRFRTDSAEVAVHLLYSAKHIGPARNSIGFYRIDGRGEDGWTFTRPAGGTLPGEAELVLEMPVQSSAEAMFHDYELILPYGDSVELRGVMVAAGARWEKPAARPETRWVAFGDSVTHGFTSSAVVHSYPFLVGESNGWEVINAGIGGRAAMARDGDFLAGLDADIFSIAIGVNNWQGGTELEVFRTQMRGLLSTLTKGKPTARVFVITPLWVAATWRPGKAKYPLEDYRGIIREVVAELASDRIQVIEGPTLVDHDAALFDTVSVHPNDAGFAQMAERLARVIR